MKIYVLVVLCIGLLLDLGLTAKRFKKAGDLDKKIANAVGGVISATVFIVAIIFQSILLCQ